MSTISVLFLCIHNSARSQMAEAYLKKLGGALFAPESAGLEPGRLNPLAVQVMQEDGIDISGNQTKDVFTLWQQGRSFNYVITVCDAKNSDRCPVFPGQQEKIAWDFDDPSGFTGDHKEQLQKTREVRDRIKSAVIEFITLVKSREGHADSNF